MKLGFLVGMLTVALVTVSANAGVILGTPSCQADGDGAVVCQPSNWDPQTNTLSVSEDVYRTPAQILGEVQTDGDPTVLIAAYVNNYTTDTWSTYQFNIYMDQPFTINSAMVPAGWTSDLTSPITAANGTFHDLDPQARPWNYMATIHFSASSPAYDLGPSALGLFGATVTFASSVNFEVEQVVPEPATLALLALGGLFMARRRS